MKRFRSNGDGTAPDAPGGPVPWDLTEKEVLARLSTSPRGLSSEEAAARLARHGPNRLQAEQGVGLTLRFLSRFRNPLVLILLGAALISFIIQERASFFIIACIILLSTLLDSIQERRAQVAVERLQSRVRETARVYREGEAMDIAAALIVPGDVVLLAAGDLVPADCRLIEAKDLFVNEGLLTGEAFPSEKHARPVPAAECQGDSVPANGVFMGTSVVSGLATAMVLRTGRGTRLGQIAQQVRREPEPTAFSIGLRDFGVTIARLTVLLALSVLLVNLLLRRPVLESFLFALALSVGLTPELLPMVVSVTLAHGALGLSRRGVIVKRPASIHDLGSMDVLCSDKTGTLTEGTIKLIRELDLAGTESREVLEVAYLNAAFETGLRSPMDEAILRAERVDLGGWRKVDEVPFDFERRMVSILLEKEDRRRLVVKGAPEAVLERSSRCQFSGDPRSFPLDEASRATARSVLHRLGDDGFRVLGVAWRDLGLERGSVDAEVETDLTFTGFAAFLDPPKESARLALAGLGRLGVEVKVITGDDDRLTRRIAGDLGLPVRGTLTGPDLESLGDEALQARLGQVNLCCRVTPPQKARVIRALRRQGRVVGYLGDGINDAPALRAADVGLSVDRAVDVAKEAATIILLEKDLQVLLSAVVEGRRTFANISKYVMMATSSNFGNMTSMALAAFILPFLPMLPVQILLNNLLYDASELAIPMDRVDEAMVERPRRWDTGLIRDFMLVLGPLSSCFDFLSFSILLLVFHAGQELFQTAWFVESIMTQVLVIFVIRTRGSPLASRPHPLLVSFALGTVALAAALPYTWLGPYFRMVPIPLEILLVLIGLTLIYLLAVEGVKRLFFARHPRA